MKNKLRGLLSTQLTVVAWAACDDFAYYHSIDFILMSGNHIMSLIITLHVTAKEVTRFYVPLTYLLTFPRGYARSRLNLGILVLWIIL